MSSLMYLTIWFDFSSVGVFGWLLVASACAWELSGCRQVVVDEYDLDETEISESVSR